MSGLEDLRRSLEAHAGEVSVSDPALRRTAVHERIRVVKRRRAGGAVAAVVAVVALVAGVADLPDSTEKSGPDPAGKVQVFGIDVPPTMTSLGFTYQLVDTVDDIGPDQKLDVAASDKARLISWATQGSDQLVTVSNPTTTKELGGGEKYAADFTDFTLVEPGLDAQIDFVSSDRLAVATYEITDDRPEGVTTDGITFRETVGDARLLAASIGDLGESSVSVSVPPGSPPGDLQLAYFCHGGGVRTTLSITPVSLQAAVGAAGAESACFDTLPVDAAQYLTADIGAVSDLTIEARSANGRPAALPDLRLGVAVYESAGLTNEMLDVFETDGHQWRLTEARPVGGDATLDVPQGAAQRLVVVELARRGGTIRVDFGGRYAGSHTSGRSRSATELPPDISTVDISISGGPVNPGDAVVGFYERAD